jgi:hypothetical protein
MVYLDSDNWYYYLNTNHLGQSFHENKIPLLEHTEVVLALHHPELKSSVVTYSEAKHNNHTRKQQTNHYIEY